MTQRTLLTLSDILNHHDPLTADGSSEMHSNIEGELSESERLVHARHKSQRHWGAAIAALESLLLSLLPSPSEAEVSQGIILAGTSPILSHDQLLTRFQVGLFAADAWQNLSLLRQQLPAAASDAKTKPPTLVELPLFPKDPIAREQFCLVLTGKFSLLMVLGRGRCNLPSFNYSFDPVVVARGWQLLRSRLILTRHPQLPVFERQVATFEPSTPDYRWVMDFSRLILQYLPSEIPSSNRRQTNGTHNRHPTVDRSLEECDNNLSSDIELLQALTHEIRTPLTTIRTMTRLLLRHKSLTPAMAKQLGTIDQECSDQIDRMELILQATELRTPQERPVQLVPISLNQVFKSGIPRWQRQARRHNVDLDIRMPSKLPQVVSDPATLDRVLTGLLEKFTRSFTSGGQIRVHVSTAGHQLKLKLQTQATPSENGFKALGQLLLFQPATGSVSLNLDTTKNLCHAMGGKLIVRQRSRQGEEITIFLPLDNTAKRSAELPLH